MTLTRERLNRRSATTLMFK